MTTLSLRSRITSSSYSFQPSTDSSTSTSPRGLCCEAPAAPWRRTRRRSRRCRARAAHRERRAQDHRVADPGRRRHLGLIARFFQRVRVARPRHGEADLLHRLLEQLAVLGLLDRLDLRADELDAVALRARPPCAASSARFSAVWPPSVGRSASGRSRSMILLEHLDGERLDVGAVGELRIGHDRRRVRVDEDDLVALLLERLDALGAGVVELAGLPDDDRARADQHDVLDVVASGHGFLRSVRFLLQAFLLDARVGSRASIWKASGRTSRPRRGGRPTGQPSSAKPSAIADARCAGCPRSAR